MEIGDNFTSENFKVANFVTRRSRPNVGEYDSEWGDFSSSSWELCSWELQGAVIFCPPRKPWRSTQGFWVSGTISSKKKSFAFSEATVLPLKRLPLCKHLKALVCDGLSVRNRSKSFSLQIINTNFERARFEIQSGDYFNLRFLPISFKFVSITIWKKIDHLQRNK